jgi:hypothetical protein
MHGGAWHRSPRVTNYAVDHALDLDDAMGVRVLGEDAPASGGPDGSRALGCQTTEV